MKVTFIICFIAQYWGYTDNDALWSARYCFSLVGRNYKEKGKYFKISFCSFIQANHGATIVWQYGSDIKIQEIELGSNVGRVLGVMRSKYVHNSIFLCMKNVYAWKQITGNTVRCNVTFLQFTLCGITSILITFDHGYHISESSLDFIHRSPKIRFELLQMKNFF